MLKVLGGSGDNGRCVSHLRKTKAKRAVPSRGFSPPNSIFLLAPQAPLVPGLNTRSRTGAGEGGVQGYHLLTPARAALHLAVWGRVSCHPPAKLISEKAVNSSSIQENVTQMPKSSRFDFSP